MSWLEKLHETYKNCAARIGQLESVGKKGKQICLLPIFHTTQNAQIEITIDLEGRFKRARVVQKNEASTVIPCTEESGGRTSGPVPHPLCDKLQYVAGDYRCFADDAADSLHQAYLQKLSAWCASPYRHPKVGAVYTYVKNGTIIADLCTAGILLQDSFTNKILSKWNNPLTETPSIFKVMLNKENPLKAFVRWSVENERDPQFALSTDATVWESWAQFYSSTQNSLGFCYVTAKLIPLAKNHPARLRHAMDSAKLISANDESGFTYRGRFINQKHHQQACSIGFEVSQKAHNALRWLISRQGYQDDSLAIIAWSTTGQPVPDPFADSRELFGEDNIELEAPMPSADIVYTAEDFAHRLKQKIKGYAADLGSAKNIVVLGLDSATPGRMSVIYYREIAGSAFLEQIKSWHADCAWRQNYGANAQFTGAPAPKDIAEIAYGRRLDKALRNKTVRQLLSCIIDDTPLPQYLVGNCIRRASNRHGFKENWEWEKALGVACSLFRKHHKHNRMYQMYLELDYKSRDYLYGRLLAIAEQIEYATFSTDEKTKRMTTAARLMQRFADYPYSTWRTICLALQPYKARLLARLPGLLIKLEKELDAVATAFTPEDFASPDKLSGEFLLGYHCQRAALKRKPKQADSEEPADESKKSN